MMAVAALTISCNKSEDTTTALYGDAAITGFTLGNINCYVDGKKTIYAGSTYSFSIDQTNRIIFNIDSLPVGTDKAHVLCNITTLNNGSVWIQSVDDPNIIEYYSAYDSIDFSTDRKFDVYASDGTGYSTYTVKLNVHKQEGEQFVWTKMNPNNVIAQMTGLKAVTNGECKYIFGNHNGHTRVLSTSDGTSWTEPVSNINTLFDADAWKNVCVKNDTIFMLSGSNIFKCTNGSDWEQVFYNSDNLTLKQLIGASTAELYGMAENNSIWMSKNGSDWTQEDMDESHTLLPTDEIVTVSYPMYLADSTDNVIMAGSRDITEYPADTISMVWRKIADYQKHAPKGQWTYMERTDYNIMALPRMKNISLLRYDDTILAIGGQGIGETYNDAYQQVYQSRDNGITWKKTTKFNMPDNFDVSISCMAAVVDENNFIWLFSAGTGEVWRGRLNRLGWDAQ